MGTHCHSTPRPILPTPGNAPDRIECTSTLTSLQDYIAKKDNSFKWSMHDVEIMDDRLHIAQILANGTAVAISDCLFKEAYGKATWIAKQHEGTLYYDDNC